jgi:hypothetical protein
MTEPLVPPTRPDAASPRDAPRSPAPGVDLLQWGLAVTPFQSSAEEATAEIDRMACALRGVLLPPPPVDSSYSSQLAYQTQCVGEQILQAALYYLVVPLFEVENHGHHISRDDRAAWWRGLVGVGLHALVRAAELQLEPYDRARITATLVDYVLRRLAGDRVPLDERDPAYEQALAIEQQYWDTALTLYRQVPVRWVNEDTVTAVRMYAAFVVSGIDLPTPHARESLAYTAVRAAESLLDAIDPDALVGRLGALARQADERA